jgi:hypothetical protein
MLLGSAKPVVQRSALTRGTARRLVFGGGLGSWDHDCRLCLDNKGTGSACKQRHSRSSSSSACYNALNMQSATGLLGYYRALQAARAWLTNHWLTNHQGMPHLQTLVAGLNLSVGQSGRMPSHFSSRSHSPAAGLRAQSMILRSHKV